jgi:N-acetylmuramoyl-L-alanine amidase
MKFVEEKERIVQELRQYGIQVILTRPEDLSINTVNKYLELKAKRMI